MFARMRQRYIQGGCLKKSQLNEFLDEHGNKTAGYILMHFVYQSQRGRYPSESFAGFTNPLDALKAAAEQIEKRITGPNQYSWFPGDSLLQVATSMCAVSRTSGITLVCDTSYGFKFIVGRYAGVKEVVQMVMDAQQEIANKWGTEIHEIDAEIDREARAIQTRVNILMRNLRVLNFKSLEKVLVWVRRMNRLADLYPFVKFDNAEIRQVFARHGYVPRVNSNFNFGLMDPTGYAEFIIGNFLTCPNVMVDKYVEHWGKTFGYYPGKVATPSPHITLH